MKIRLARTSLVLAMALAGAPALGQSTGPTEWKDWGGDAARMHYSPLKQIDASNVANLKPVWVWDSGEFGRSWEITPLLVDGLLYISENQSGDIIALTPETGKEVWRAKPPVKIGGAIDRRGLAYWPGDGAMKPRIIAIWGHVMYGFDIKTGQQSSDWPATGLDIGLPNPAQGGRIGGGVQSNSPPIIYKNMIITTGASGFLPPPAQPADPHANDLRTGKLVWTARLIPAKGEPGGDSWGPETQSVVGSGAWGHMALDEATGTVYVPATPAVPIMSASGGPATMPAPARPSPLMLRPARSNGCSRTSITTSSTWTPMPRPRRWRSPRAASA